MEDGATSPSGQKLQKESFKQRLLPLIGFILLQIVHRPCVTSHAHLEQPRRAAPLTFPSPTRLCIIYRMRKIVDF